MMFKLYLFGIISWIVKYTDYIFPEFPPIGAAVVGVAFLLFVFYLIKQGFGSGLKVATAVILGSAVTLFSVHSIIQIFKFFFP